MAEQIFSLRATPKRRKKRRMHERYVATGQADLYILTDDLADVMQTLNQLKTEMSHTCIRAFLKPDIDISSVSWAPRHLYRFSLTVGKHLDDSVNFIDAVLYLSEELKHKAKENQLFMPTLAVCIGTTSDKIRVLDLPKT